MCINNEPCVVDSFSEQEESENSGQLTVVCQRNRVLTIQPGYLCEASHFYFLFHFPCLLIHVPEYVQLVVEFIFLLVKDYVYCVTQFFVTVVYYSKK